MFQRENAIIIIEKKMGEKVLLILNFLEIVPKYLQEKRSAEYFYNNKIIPQNCQYFCKNGHTMQLLLLCKITQNTIL